MNLTGPSVKWEQVFPFNYYDYPEGTHLAQKLGCTGSTALLTSAAVCSIELPLRSKPQTMVAGLNRIVYLTSPLVGMAAAFTSAAFISCRLRGKDDALNYLVGGVAAGHIFGAFSRNLWYGFVASLGLGAIAVTKKVCIDNGWDIVPKEMMRECSSLRVRNRDWTLIQDRPKGWTTGRDGF